MIAAKCDAAALIAKLGGVSEKADESVAEAIEQSTQRVAEIARQKLSGGVLSVRSGKLLASLTGYASDMTGRVTSDAPYARIQEYGGRIEVPDIVPQSARALAFPYEGKLVFAKHAAAHAVSIPERSYLRSALDERAQAFADDVRKVVTGLLA